MEKHLKMIQLDNEIRDDSSGVKNQKEVLIAFEIGESESFQHISFLNAVLHGKLCLIKIQFAFYQDVLLLKEKFWQLGVF